MYVRTGQKSPISVDRQKSRCVGTKSGDISDPLDEKFSLCSHQNSLLIHPDKFMGMRKVTVKLVPDGSISTERVDMFGVDRWAYCLSILKNQWDQHVK